MLARGFVGLFALAASAAPQSVGPDTVERSDVGEGTVLRLFAFRPPVKIRADARAGAAT
jgi:hypothetical protein